MFNSIAKSTLSLYRGRTIDHIGLANLTQGNTQNTATKLNSLVGHSRIRKRENFLYEQKRLKHKLQIFRLLYSIIKLCFRITSPVANFQVLIRYDTTLPSHDLICYKQKSVHSRYAAITGKTSSCCFHYTFLHCKST